MILWHVVFIIGFDRLGNIDDLLASRLVAHFWRMLRCKGNVIYRAFLYICLLFSEHFSVGTLFVCYDLVDVHIIRVFGWFYENVHHIISILFQYRIITTNCRNIWCIVKIIIWNCYIFLDYRIIRFQKWFGHVSVLLRRLISLVPKSIIQFINVHCLNFLSFW